MLNKCSAAGLPWTIIGEITGNNPVSFLRRWNERIEKGIEFQIVGAAIWNERKPKDRLMRGTCELAEECDHNVQAGT